jgi:hypothetical protein
MTVIAIVIAASLCAAQIYFYVRTRDAAEHLHDLFPVQIPMARLLRGTEPESAATGDAPLQETRSTDADAPATPAGVSLVSSVAPSEGFAVILGAINGYLDRNRGMPVTFLVLQDIVERTRESFEQAASANVTLPLYIGLMGTFVGVILGLGSLSTGHAPSMEDTDMRRFLNGVLVAMFGSLVGLFLYVAGRRRLARAQRASAFRKRDFLIFLQIELLPAAGEDVAMALYSLQANLGRFNEDFGAHLKTFGTAMLAPAQALKQQKELLQALQATDLKYLLEANRSMLESLKTAAPVLEQFLATSLQFVSKLQDANLLTERVTELLSRFTSFEEGVNALGTRVGQESFVTDSVVQLIGGQLDALKSRGETVKQFLDIQEDTIRKSLRGQQVQVDEMFTAARQEIQVAGHQLSRSITEVVTPETASELMSYVALLKEHGELLKEQGTALKFIAQRTEASEAALRSMVARPENPRVEDLLMKILSTLKDQAERPFLPHLFHRLFPGKKG